MAEIRYRYDEVTNTKVPYRHVGLPTAEEYAELALRYSRHDCKEWSEPMYKCPECGGGMCKNLKVAFLTYPMKYLYKCNKCEYIEYQHI